MSDIRTSIAAIFADLPVVETERLRLRPLTMDDAPALFAYGSDPDVTRYTSWVTHRSVADAETFLATVVGRYERGEAASWAVTLRETGDLIGTAGFISVDAEAREGVLGYAFGQPHWGKGYASEAARASLRFGFEVVRLRRIEATCYLENAGSIAILEKLGMMRICIGEELDHEGVLRDDLATYEIYARGLGPTT
jgi:[ribosomal protein S5]-alanine N-acetyltransferase